jgi:hypothetical protein
MVMIILLYRTYNRIKIPGIHFQDQKNELFTIVPDSRINSWETWFIFNLQKINNQYRESIPGYKIIVTCIIGICDDHTGKKTYLNSRLLGAPREYVLHGLDPVLN